MSGASKKTPTPAPCLFSIDVEDWFHILALPSTPPLAEWDHLASRVESNFERLLEILETKQVKATCFFLGWVAEKYPHLVLSAAKAGHEIAAHGYAHRLVYEMNRQEFVTDAAKTKRILEDSAGKSVIGYRAAGFSVNESTPWFFEALTEAGYLFDSSIFPAARMHGGMKTGPLAPYRLHGGLLEIPISVVPMIGLRICFFGGGYLRLFPYSVVKTMACRVLNSERPVTFYLHPREIDPAQPRLPMNAKRRFKSYINLSSTEPKMRRLLGDFDWMTYGEYLNRYFSSGENT